MNSRGDTFNCSRAFFRASNARSCTLLLRLSVLDARRRRRLLSVILPLTEEEEEEDNVEDESDDAVETVLVPCFLAHRVTAASTTAASAPSLRPKFRELAEEEEEDEGVDEEDKDSWIDCASPWRTLPQATGDVGGGSPRYMSSSSPTFRLGSTACCCSIVVSGAGPLSESRSCRDSTTLLWSLCRGRSSSPCARSRLVMSRGEDTEDMVDG